MKHALSDEDLVTLFHALANTLHGGRLLAPALEETARRCQGGRLGDLIARLGHHVRGGATLAQAMAEEGVFPPHAIRMMDSGERLGAPEVVASRLAASSQLVVEQKQWLRWRLLYPLLVGLGALLLVGFW